MFKTFSRPAREIAVYQPRIERDLADVPACDKVFGFAPERHLLDQHNVNLHADGDGDGYLDRDEPSEIELAMHEVSLEELMCQPC